MATFIPAPQDPLAIGIRNLGIGAGQGIGNLIQQRRQAQGLQQDLTGIQQFLLGQQTPGGPQLPIPTVQTPAGQNILGQLLTRQATQQPSLLTPQERVQAAQIKAGLRPKATEPSAADFQLVKGRDQFVRVNKRTGEQFPTGITPEITTDKLRANEIIGIQEKIKAGKGGPGDVARMNNLMSNVSVNNPRPAPVALYQKIDKDAAGARVSQKLLAAFQPGKGGAESVGLIDSIKTYMETELGLLTPEKQVFLQDRTKLFSALKALNGEARMSDADLKFLINLIPKARQGEAAWKAALENLHADSVQQLKIGMNRLDANKFTIAEENREYYQSLMDIEGSPQQQPSLNIGSSVQRGGKNYRVVGFDTDGEPLVEEVL